MQLELDTENSPVGYAFLMNERKPGNSEWFKKCMFADIYSNIYVVTPSISPFLGPLTRCCLKRITSYCNQTCLLLKLCKYFSHCAF